MKKIAVVIFALAVISGLCYAADVEKTPKATEPVGAVIETGGVFVGKIIGSVEKATTGKKEITVQSDTGETRVFPFAETTELVDNTFNALTFNQLKAGEKVKVEYKKEGGAAKAVTVQK